MVKVAICGGGNGAHVLSGLASSHGHDVSVFTLFSDESERWTAKMAANNGDFTVNAHKPDGVVAIKAKPFKVTKKPEEAIPGCDILVLTVPAFAHAQYFNAMKPHITGGMVIAGMPGQPGFEFEIRSILGAELLKKCTVMSFESLPWACRISEFGSAVDVLGTKATLMGSLQMGSPAPSQDPTHLLQVLLGEFPKLDTKGHLLGVTLMSPNGYIHPAILYGKWRDWDGTPCAEKPLFYHGLGQSDGEFAIKVCDEIVAIAQGIMKQRPQADLTNVEHLYAWYMRCYGGEITDKTNLYTAIRTNAAYKGLCHPMKEAEGGKWVPDFNNRYLSEDIPYGLVVMRGIAELAAVETPHIDKMLLWAQDKLGKEYLVNGKIAGKDISVGRSPQRYGLKDLDTILGIK